MSKIIKQTVSFCDTCLKKIPAEVIEARGSIYIRKYCERHGIKTHIHRFDDPDIYYFLNGLNVKGDAPAGGFLNITRRCNLLCPICYNSSGGKPTDQDIPVQDLPRLDEYSQVYISGGEPTCREDLMDIISKYKKSGKRVVLCTNGVKLNDPGYVKNLRGSGVDTVLVSFDGLDDNIYIGIRGQPLLDHKLRAIENLNRHNIPVGFCYTIVMNINSSRSEIVKQIELLKEYRNIKTINFAPAIDGRKVDSGIKNKPEGVRISSVLNHIEESFGLCKQDYFDSTELLINISNIMLRGNDKKRTIPKCALYCLVYLYGDSLIPINKIFDIKRINNKLQRIETASIFGRCRIFSYIFVTQICINIFRNKYLKSLVLDFIKRLGYLFTPHKSLVNPFVNISCQTLQSTLNYDEDFARFCNRDYFDGRAVDEDMAPLCGRLIRTNNIAKKQRKIAGHNA